MLFLLRKLRRSFFLPGKLRTYLAYAIGEVILIVIGILIAVQIGDWKEARNLEGQRVQLVDNLTTDFQTNLVNLDIALERTDEIMQNFDQFLIDIFDDEKHLTLQEIQYMSNFALAGMEFRPLLGAYRSAITSGSFSLIRNSDLSELIRNFEEQSAAFQSHNELGRQDFFFGGISRLRAKLGSLASLQPEDTPHPDAFIYSDEYYHDFLRQKDVYSILENLYTLKKVRQESLLDLNDLTKEILYSLEALD